MFKEVVIEYSTKKINKELLTTHICDVIKNKIEGGQQYGTKENSRVA